MIWSPFPIHILFGLPTTIKYHQVPTIEGLWWLPWGLNIDDHWTYPTITISDPEARDQTLIESEIYRYMKRNIMVINNNQSQSQIHSLKTRPVTWNPFPNHILFGLPTTIKYHQVPTIEGLWWLPWGLKINDHWTYPTITISDPEARDQTLIESNNCIKICIMVINNNISQSQIHSLKPVQWSGALFQFISYLGCQIQSSTIRYPPLRIYDGYPGA